MTQHNYPFSFIMSETGKLTEKCIELEHFLAFPSARRKLERRHAYKYTVFIVQAYQTSQYVVLRGSIFLGKWRSSFAGSSEGKMNVQSACALSTRYKAFLVNILRM
jgi:hypothetical protein